MHNFSKIKIFVFISMICLGYIAPLNSETNEEKDYSKYTFYEKCMESDNSSVSKCLKEANEKIEEVVEQQPALPAKQGLMSKPEVKEE